MKKDEEKHQTVPEPTTIDESNSLASIMLQLLNKEKEKIKAAEEKEAAAEAVKVRCRTCFKEIAPKRLCSGHGGGGTAVVVIVLPLIRHLKKKWAPGMSKDSGIICLARNNPCQGSEMIDTTVSENIRTAFNNDLDYFSGLSATYNIFVGTHYDVSLRGRVGSKGVLDYLIFPLVARKLIADTYLDERKENCFSNVLAWVVAIPLELTRFSVAIALTLLLAPIVTLVHIIRACLPKNNEAIHLLYLA